MTTSTAYHTRPKSHVSSSSLEDKRPTTEVESSITTSSSSFEIIHHGDNEQEIRTVPLVPYKRLTAPITPQDIQDIWSESFSDDDEGDITAVNKGTSNLTVGKKYILVNIRTLNQLLKLITLKKTTMPMMKLMKRTFSF